MKILKIMSLVLLVTLCIPFLSMSSAPTPLALGINEVSVTRSADPVLPSPEPPHQLIPLRLLVYTEYADVDEEVVAVFASINATYGTDYYWTNLTDYNDLNTLLPSHDVLLIPEQEQTPDPDTMESIGNTWSSILPNWVTQGGIVVAMDCFAFPAGFNGPTAHLVNETGLLEIYDPLYFWGAPQNLINQSDALARGVTTGYTAPDGSLRFDVADGTVVVEDGPTSRATVVHKIIGQGHVAMLGFDMWSRNADIDAILANALRLHRHVVFDESHGQFYSILNSYSDFTDDLVAEGFAVSRMGSFSSSLLDACDVLVVTVCTISYSAAEKAIISSFIDSGGGVFLAANWGPWSVEIDDLANSLGYDVEYEQIQDTDDTEPPLNIIGYPFYDTTNMQNHSLTIEVSSVQFYAGTGITSMPAGAVPIVFTDSDGTAQWDNGTVVNAMPCYVAGVHGPGRVVVAGEGNFLADDYDNDSDGTDDYYDRDNSLLARNTIRWLSAAGITERIVLFDESTNPAFTISFGFGELARYLTSNGYTVKWMSTFYPSLLAQAHVLVICDGGSSSYTAGQITDIVSFVGAGGGLFLIGDNTVLNDIVSPIASQFGLIYNETALYDTDDFIGDPRYIIWDGANIGTHPITLGIQRMESNLLTGFHSIGSGTGLVITDGDGTTTWGSGGPPAINAAVFAATNYQLGRVVASCDLNIFDNSIDYDADGETLFYDSDNNLFGVNAFQWLSENRPPVVTVTTPNGGETLTGGTNSITWTAQDPNKDSMIFDIFYSVNGGSTWTSIATGQTTTSINWDVTSVTESSDVLIRVVAHDYELSGQDESNAVFSVESEGPVISNVVTNPSTPLPGLPVTVSADITDVSGVTSAVCQVSVDGGSTWIDHTMNLVSGDNYEVDIGAYLAGTTVEYRITATDSSAAARVTTTSTFSFTIAAGPPPGIPGFPLEAIIIALATGLGLIMVARRRRRKVSS